MAFTGPGKGRRLLCAGAGTSGCPQGHDVSAFRTMCFDYESRAFALKLMVAADALPARRDADIVACNRTVRSAICYAPRKSWRRSAGDI